MKINRIVVLGICISMMILSACSKEDIPEQTNIEESVYVQEDSYEEIEETEINQETESIVETEGITETDLSTKDIAEQTGMCVAVPEEYYEEIEEAGTVVELQYDSKDYAGDESDIVKKVYVYLPYGYDEDNEDVSYDVCYLMHGLWGYAGEFFMCWDMKEMLDHMIKNGDIKPTIFVSATFYYEGCEDDYDSSVKELRVFNQDFENNLMPFIESQFHTYAQSTSKEDLIASRDHRAFGGFSLGAYTTWMQFCHCSDYIRYYLPISGACWYYGGVDNFQTEKNVDYIEKVVSDNNLNEKGYFIYYAVGTEDEIKSQTLTQAEEMLKRNDIFTPDHFVFYQMEGGEHDRRAERDFLYNGLPTFFKDSQ